MRWALVLGGASLALACAGGGAVEETPPQAEPHSAPPQPNLDDPRLTPHDPPEPLLQPEPIRTEHAPLCDQHRACALLVHYTIQQLEDGDICEICGDQDGRWCRQRWPFSEPPPCSEWAELEHCVWQTSGARRLPDLDVPARENVIELQRRLDDQIACIPD